MKGLEKKGDSSNGEADYSDAIAAQVCLRESSVVLERKNGSSQIKLPFSTFFDLNFQLG